MMIYLYPIQCINIYLAYIFYINTRFKLKPLDTKCCIILLRIKGDIGQFWFISVTFLLKFQYQASIWFMCHIHNEVVSSCETYHVVSNKSITTSVITHAFIPCFSGLRVAHSLVFSVVCCRPLYHFLVCYSSLYGVRLPMRCLQTFLIRYFC